MRPGRLAVLRLRGKEGGLDFWVVYLDASDREAREASMAALASRMSSMEEATSFLVGASTSSSITRTVGALRGTPYWVRAGCGG